MEIEMQSINSYPNLKKIFFENKNLSSEDIFEKIKIKPMTQKEKNAFRLLAVYKVEGNPSDDYIKFVNYVENITNTETNIDGGKSLRKRKVTRKSGKSKKHRHTRRNKKQNRRRK